MTFGKESGIQKSPNTGTGSASPGKRQHKGTPGLQKSGSPKKNIGGKSPGRPAPG